jgi:outer membrane protein
LNAESEVKLTKERLLILLGVSVADPNYQSVEFRPVDENEAKNITASSSTLRELPAFKRNQLLVRSSDLNIDLASRKYGPEFYLTTGIAYKNNDYVNSNQGFSSTERIEWKALLGIKWQLWDWGQRKNDVSIARLTSTIRSRELELADQTLRSNYSSALVRFSNAQNSLSTAQELMTLETSNYDYLQNQYRTGALSYLNLVDGLESLIQAQNSYYRSYHDVLQEHSTLLSFEGRLHDFLQK